MKKKLKCSTEKMLCFGHLPCFIKKKNRTCFTVTHSKKFRKRKRPHALYADNLKC